MTKGRIVAALGLGTLALVFAGRAHASDPCIADAKGTFTECKADGKENYQTAKDTCLNRDHDCVEGCRAGRSECVDATSLDEDLAVCRDALRQAKDKCRADHVGDEQAIDQCIDQVQVVAFLCRRTARTVSKPAITACRAGFRACARACGPAVVPVDARQCKLDAKNAYLASKADCREGFQSQKDLCLNRDHVCVEGCRAGRDTCRQPIEDQLDADIAACNATRTLEVQNCESLYAEDDPQRAVCITDAQVDAFQCRDGKREIAKPGFAACGDQFQICATACPPAS